MKKYIITFTLLTVALILSACTPNYLNNDTTSTMANQNNDQSKNNKYSKAPDVLAESERLNKKVVMKTSKGTIEFELFGDKAPITVSNFIFLTKEKFYDGLIFHRVEKSINIIQGGDPLGTGIGGPGYTIAEEPPVSNTDYKEGIVAMAKTAAPNSTGSQFFIMTGDFDGFNPEYSVFGKVTKGMDIVKSIVVSDIIEQVTIENK